MDRSTPQPNQVATPLVGKELLEFVKANPNMTRGQLARQAGYVVVSKKSGKESADLLGFLDAITEAKGILMRAGRATRTTRYQTTVHQSGILLIGTNYVSEFGVGPGDTFDIILENDGIKLRLAQRVEGSPLPVKLPERKPRKAKAEASAEASAEPAMAAA